MGLGGDVGAISDRLRDESESAHLATEAMLGRTLIAVSSDLDENADAVTGFVQSIEEAADAIPRQWRITILEADGQHSMVILL